uniref:Uncharacterized protein n=1 Tax=Pyricularia oryzae (strain P131) TaxID=1143193 RepID=L7IUN5_PYRO1
MRRGAWVQVVCGQVLTESRYCFYQLLWLLGTQLQSRAWINGTASPDSPLKTAWRRMGRTWVECLSAKKLAVCSYSAGTASVPGKQVHYPYLSSGSCLILDWGCYCYHVTA